MLLLPVDQSLHILELAVSLAHQEKGIGSALLCAGENYAQENKYNEITLTTYRDPSWNAPFYARKGYQQFEPQENQRALLNIINDERDAGFHKMPRVVMRKAISNL